ncbi:glycosyltransferase [Parvibacter caecicola]|uniref:Glycosyltransferase family 4 protein n=2 Tax=Parvibacter caecicola TaxID=747645 RepID=A0A4T9TAU1_9ACTN|nr:glycosyltransferase family 4 protein [Parvibacter caecicola]
MNPQSDKPQLLYVGGFELPDKNAAAQRVLAVAKACSDIGYEVCFLSYSPEVSALRETDVQGFRCFEFPCVSRAKALFDVSAVRSACSELPALRGVIAYNFPTIALWRLKRLCSRRGLLCIGDVTEWYSAKGYAPIKRELKALDTFLRMRVLNGRMDGLIVISRYLEGVYSGDCPVVLVPPLVDRGERKWQCDRACLTGGEEIVIGYAGSPSRTKERLDIVLECAAATWRDDLRFCLIGLEERDYSGMYGKPVPDGANVTFLGRVEHGRALQIVASCDYTIIFRDKNRVTEAGFPTKFVESVSLGTPVICNDNSDLAHWINSSCCGMLSSPEELKSVFANLEKKQVTVADRWVFDYRRYKRAIAAFMDQVEKGGGKDHDYMR